MKCWRDGRPCSGDCMAYDPQRGTCRFVEMATEVTIAARAYRKKRGIYRGKGHVRANTQPQG